MRLDTKCLRFCGLCAAVLTLSGCGSGSRHALHGTVTLDGQPVADGTISFLPAPGTTGNSSGSAIKDGQYSLAAANGLQSGEYRVTIEARRPTGGKVRDPQTGKLFDEVLPVTYREMGKLTVTIPASGGEASFELTTK